MQNSTNKLTPLQRANNRHKKNLPRWKMSDEEVEKFNALREILGEEAFGRILIVLEDYILVNDMEGFFENAEIFIPRKDEN
jgi:hypothetical protein